MNFQLPTIRRKSLLSLKEKLFYVCSGEWLFPIFCFDGTVFLILYHKFVGKSLNNFLRKKLSLWKNFLLAISWHRILCNSLWPNCAIFISWNSFVINWVNFLLSLQLESRNNCHNLYPQKYSQYNLRGYKVVVVVGGGGQGSVMIKTQIFALFDGLMQLSNEQKLNELRNIC